MKKTSLLLAACVMMVVLGSWGFFSHKTIHQLAIYGLPSSLQRFMASNLDYLVANSIRPDLRRKEDPKEDTKHFIDADAPPFGKEGFDNIPENWQDAVKKYSEDTLRKYGTVPWEVLLIQAKLTHAFRHKLKDSILFYAADLGHYISDAHVPLHTSFNYDGQLTNQKGLHSLWESAVPETNVKAYHLFQKSKAHYLKNPQAEIFQVLRASNAMLPQVFGEEIKASEGFTDATKFQRSEKFGGRKTFSPAFVKAYAEHLGDSVNERILQAARCTADFWFTAWVNAGRPDLSDLTTTSPDFESALKAQRKAWKNNQLIEKGLLQSMKTPEK